MKYHAIKYNLSTLQTIILPSEEVIEKLDELQPDKAIALFELGLERIKMLEEERNLLGKEVAYIYEVEKKFRR